MVAARLLLACCVCLMIASGAAIIGNEEELTKEELAELLKIAYDAYKNKADGLDEMKGRLATLARQLVMQQLYVEERARSDGDSGIKQVR